MRVAIPLAEGKLTAHFGHCAEFALLDVDEHSKTISARETVPAPPHQPGLLPVWLAEKGVNFIIAGGMGQRALTLFTDQGISVVVGAQPETPEKLVLDWLQGSLEQGTNYCDH
jgi:predicted Fe-Mo cluster-binding NifX family protein